MVNQQRVMVGDGVGGGYDLSAAFHQISIVDRSLST